MKLNELFERLSYGELSNLSLSIDGGGTIEERHHAKVTHFINEGLLKLYSKFVLSQKQLLIEMVQGITNYHLDPKYAETQWDSGEVPYPYIKDLGREKFIGDVIRVNEVYGENGKLPLNDLFQSHSVFTPTYKVLQVPHVVDYGTLNVIYQAKHPILTPDNLEADIELPDVLESALMAYVGYRVYTLMNTADASAKAQEHLSNFYRICDEVVANDLVGTSVSTVNDKFTNGGWL